MRVLLFMSVVITAVATGQEARVDNGISGISDTIFAKKAKPDQLLGEFTGYVEFIGQAAAYRRTGLYTYAGLSGSVGFEGGLLPLTLQWYFNPQGYGVGPLPLTTSINFNRDEFEDWVSGKAAEMIQKQGFEYMSIVTLEQRISALEKHLASVDISMLERRLREKELRGDTLSEEYRKLKREIERYKKYKAKLEEMRRTYAQLLAMYEQYKAFQNKVDPKEAMAYLEKQKYRYYKLMNILNYVKGFNLGRFSYNDLNFNRSIMLTGINLETEINNWILGVRGGFGENVLLTRGFYKSYWTVGATLGRKISGVDVVGKYDFVNNSRGKDRQHTAALDIKNFPLGKKLKVSGGIVKQWTYRNSQIDSFIITEGAISNITPSWQSSGNSYWASLEKSGNFWTMLVKGTYFDDSYNDLLIPYQVAGTGNVEVESAVSGKVKDFRYKLDGEIEYGIQNASYLWQFQPLFLGKYGAGLSVAKQKWKLSLRGYKVENVKIKDGKPTYNVNGSFTIGLGKLVYTYIYLRQWKSGFYISQQHVGNVIIRGRLTRTRVQGVWSRSAFQDIQSIVDKYKGDWRTYIRVSKALEPFVGAGGYHSPGLNTRVLGNAGLKWIYKFLMVGFGVGVGYEWDYVFDSGVVGEGTVKIRVQW